MPNKESGQTPAESRRSPAQRLFAAAIRECTEAFASRSKDLRRRLLQSSPGQTCSGRPRRGHRRRDRGDSGMTPAHASGDNRTLGDIHLVRGDMEKAIAFCDTAIQLDPFPGCRVQHAAPAPGCAWRDLHGALRRLQSCHPTGPGPVGNLYHARQRPLSSGRPERPIKRLPSRI